MTKIEKLQKKIRAIRQQIEDIQAPKRLAANKKLLGKCFKYHNGYGSGEKWWLYVKVVSCDASQVNSFQFQDDGMDKMETRNEAWFNNINTDGYVPITHSEFYEAWQKFITKLNNQIVKTIGV